MIFKETIETLTIDTSELDYEAWEFFDLLQSKERDYILSFYIPFLFNVSMFNSLEARKAQRGIYFSIVNDKGTKATIGGLALLNGKLVVEFTKRNKVMALLNTDFKKLNAITPSTLGLSFGDGWIKARVQDTEVRDLLYLHGSWLSDAVGGHLCLKDRSRLQSF